MAGPERTPYDVVPYQGTIVPNTAPEHLALCAHWHDGPRPPLHGFRYAELGCGDGANLIPLAFYHPASAFVGVDSSAAELDRARAAASTLGLRNVRFVHRDVRDMAPDDTGPADYVVAHGLYSWVPDDARDAILAFCGAGLTPSGVAYVSYNAQPGWAVRRVVRDALRRARPVREAALEDKAARAIEVAGRLLDDLPPRHYAHAVLLAEELERVRNGRPSYVLHEYLASHNDGFWLRDVVERARGHGLAYVADAQFCRPEGHVPAALHDALAARDLDPLEREETADLLGSRSFRASVLRRADAPCVPTVRRELLERVHVALSLEAASDPFDLADGVEEAFAGRDGQEVTLTASITKAAAVRLAARWPAGLPLRPLVEHAAALLERHSYPVPEGAEERLADDLTVLFEAGQADFRLEEPNRAEAAAERPLAHALARFEAGRENGLTTALHLSLALDPPMRTLIRALDGRRTRAELRQTFGDELLTHTLSVLEHWGLLAGD